MEVKYNKIGSNYNSTWKADPFLTKKLLEHLKPEKDGLYLDIGCGTGNYSIALNKKGTSTQGLIKLRKDINSGQINGIINSFDNDYGDYLSIVGNKANM